MSTPDTPKCGICGEPMPEGESKFKFHGYSGPCPKPPSQSPAMARERKRAAAYKALHAAEMAWDEYLKLCPPGPVADWARTVCSRLMVATMTDAPKT